MSGLGQLLKLPPALEGEAAQAEGNDRGPYADPPARPAGDSLTRATEALRELLGGGERPAGEWAAALDAALLGPGGLVRAAVEGYESLEVETSALRADLDALRAIDEQLGGEPLTLEAFARGVGAAHAAARGAAAPGGRRAVRAAAHAARAALRARLHRRPRGRRVSRAAPRRPPARSRGARAPGRGGPGAAAGAALDGG